MDAMNVRGMLRGRLAVAIAAAGLVIPLVACDEDDGNGTGPDGQGSVQAMVTDDPGASSGSLAGARGSVSGSEAFDVNGSFTGQARVDISADGETWVELGQMQQLDVALQAGEQVTLHTAADVPAGAYSRVRLVVEDAQADILAGSTIGAGPISADVTIQVAGGEEFTIERTVSVDVEADAQTTVVFDLNSQAWLDEAAVQAQSATAAAVESAATVSVE